VDLPKSLELPHGHAEEVVHAIKVAESIGRHNAALDLGRRLAYRELTEGQQNPSPWAYRAVAVYSSEVELVDLHGELDPYEGEDAERCLEDAFERRDLVLDRIVPVLVSGARLGLRGRHMMVLRAVADLALRRADRTDDVVRTSLREMGLMTATRPATVHEILGELVELGLLERLVPPRRRREGQDVGAPALRVRLLDPLAHACTHASREEVSELYSHATNTLSLTIRLGAGRPSHDAWRDRAGGQNGQVDHDVVLTLASCVREATVPKLSRLTGWSESAVRRSVKRLREVGLVNTSGHANHLDLARMAEGLDRLAELRDSVGTGDRYRLRAAADTEARLRRQRLRDGQGLHRT